MAGLDRYHRQMLLPQMGEAAQRRLAAARVLLIGCGALGSAIAEQLIRAGVGSLAIADRDIVELSNLQRQVLFTEADALEAAPKAVAAAARLRAINSSVEVSPHVIDVHSGNIAEIAQGIDLILDGTDNVQTRYLINDLAVKQGVPWVYGAAVGVEGRVMAIRPGQSPCLRCIFPSPPAPHDLPTCDTAGVLGMAPAIVGAWQAIEALKVLIHAPAEPALLRFDFWRPRVHITALDGGRRDDCLCCARRQFEFLDASFTGTVSLCGRNAIQVRPPPGAAAIEFDALQKKLAAAGRIERTAFLLRCHLHDPQGVTLTVFADGRSIVQGLSDPDRARSLHARFVGL